MYINCTSTSHTLFISDMCFLLVLILCKIRVNTHNNSFHLPFTVCLALLGGSLNK